MAANQPSVGWSAFKGMDNRHRAEMMPDGYLRNAVNVRFDALGKARKIEGITKRYTGTGIHSYWNGYFVENGTLKYLNSDYTATTLATVGDKPMGYTHVTNNAICGNGDVCYWLNPFKPVGVKWPEQQPALAADVGGGMFAGDYQVAITYIRNGEESGCGQASRITLTEGQGIVVTVPTVPADIDTIAVYVSSVNDGELYLYDEYPSDTATVRIINDISTVRLETQFLYPPIFSNILQAHYGRIYWADGSLLRYTEALKYGLTRAGNFVQFAGDITLIVSLPGVLYVVADKTYKIVNIDGEGFKNRAEVLPYGGIKGSLTYDDNFKRAFWLSDKGIVSATSEGVTELLADYIALPKYTEAALTLVESDGIKQLIAVGQGGTVSSLMDKDFKASEITRKGNAL